MLLLVVTMAAWVGPAAADTTDLTASPYNPNELSYGLYWFGEDGANQKFVAGEANPYFAPTKPTLIFAHGWQPTLSSNLPTLSYNGTDTVAGWIAEGWNVGMFVWNQFSDETSGITGSWFGDGAPPQGVLDAEAKIWTANGPQGMRWRDWDTLLLPPANGYSDAPAGTPSAGELFYQAYTAAMTEQPYTGGNIRLAGHSLGNQMVVRLAKMVHDDIAADELPETLRPTRVALLDPYWSPAARDDLSDGAAAGRRTGDVVREYIAELIPGGTLFEWYWSSIWTTPPQGYANEELQRMTFYAEMDPAFESQNVDKHLVAQHLYLWSYAFAGPAACTGEACLDMTRVLAQMSNEQLAAVTRSDYRWAQQEGQDTATPADDTYASALHSGGDYTVMSLNAHPVQQTVGEQVAITARADGAPDGTLVSLWSDLGTIAPRAVIRRGETTVALTSEVSGTAHISATTRGFGGVVQSSATVTFTQEITGVTPPETPTIQFSSENYTVSETDGTASITVTLTSPATQEVTVAYATSNGTATAGHDYTPISGTLTIATGERSNSFAVAIHSDTEAEEEETVSLALDNPTNATLGTLSNATLRITDVTIIDGRPPSLYLPLVSR